MIVENAQNVDVSIAAVTHLPPSPPLCHDILFVISSLLYLALAIILPDAWVSFNTRPIPLQPITISGITIYLKDLELTNTYIPDSEETVPGYLLAVIGLAIPLVIFVVMTTLVWPVAARQMMKSGARSSDTESNLLVTSGSTSYTKPSSPPLPSNKFTEFRRIFVSFIIATSTNLAITGATKRYVGRLRPCFYEMCGYDDATQTCTATSTLQMVSRSSFPSGHASVSFCSMVFVALYVYALTSPVLHLKFHNPFIRSSISYALLLLPLFLAIFVAASRLYDNWHHPSDVLAGSIIGTFCAVTGFGFFYSSKGMVVQ